MGLSIRAIPHFFIPGYQLPRFKIKTFTGKMKTSPELNFFLISKNLEELISLFCEEIFITISVICFAPFLLLSAQLTEY